MELDWSVVRRPPLEWQPEAVEKIVSQPFVANFDYMGMGKTYSCLAAAAMLYKAGEIDFLVIAAPPPVLGVWDDPVTGEIFETLNIDFSVCRIWRGHPRICDLSEGKKHFRIYTVSYAFFRTAKYVADLERSMMHKRFMLIMDESSHIKNRGASQTRGLKKVRGWAKRRVICNGTPVPNDVTDLWSQMDMLDPKSLQSRNWYQFRNMFARMGGYMGKVVVGIQNEELLWSSLKPWVIMRKRERPATYATVPVTMPPALQKIYDDMNAEMIAWLGSDEATASHAGTKALRLAQITSGFLGGFKTNDCVNCGLDVDYHDPDLAPDDAVPCANFRGMNLPPREVDDTKTSAVVNWVIENSLVPTIVFARFRPELLRLNRILKEAGIPHSLMIGGQGRDRQEGINDFMLGRNNLIVAQLQTGSEGLNLGRAEAVLFLSNDYNAKTRDQAEGRARPKIGHPVIYIDFLMTSAAGKKTIDHVIRKKLDHKFSVAKWTCQDWLRELEGL